MSEWSFIRTIIKQAKQNKKDVPSFRKTLAKDIKEEKAFRKKAGKEFNRRYTDEGYEIMGEDVYEPITEGRNSRAYINNRIENFKDDDDLEKGFLKYLNRTKQ